MATVGQFKLANRLIEVIKKNPNGIHKFDLMDHDTIRISIGTYDKIKPWFEHKFREIVRYEKKSQSWFPIFSEEIGDDGGDEDSIPKIGTLTPNEKIQE